MVLDITCVTGSYLCFYVHLADLSSVRYNTSTWNEIKELIKSNYLIVASLLNKSPKKMTWNDRWETKQFLEGHGTARWIERKWNEQPQSSSVFLTLLNVSPDFEQKVALVFIFFLIIACILQFAQYFLVTFNFPTNWNCNVKNPHTPIWVNYHSFWFTIIFERWQSEIWNDILIWYFKLLFFSR